jgi:hypothetical protein
MIPKVLAAVLSISLLFGDGCFLETRQKDKSRFGAKFNNKIQNFGKFLGTRFSSLTQ